MRTDKRPLKGTIATEKYTFSVFPIQTQNTKLDLAIKYVKVNTESSFI